MPLVLRKKGGAGGEVRKGHLEKKGENSLKEKQELETRGW